MGQVERVNTVEMLPKSDTEDRSKESSAKIACMLLNRYMRERDKEVR